MKHPQSMHGASGCKILKNVFGFSLAVIATWFGGCTSYTKTHVIKWSGVFMVDSITAGAVRLEYHEETPNNNTFANGRTYGINQKLYYYNFKNDSLYLFATLNGSLSDIPFSFSDNKDVDFNYPLLMYITASGGNTITSIYNVETKSNLFSTPFRGFLSSGRKYLVGQNQLLNVIAKDTSVIENSNHGDLFFFSDTSGVGYGVAARLRNPPFPIFKYGPNGTVPESLGVLNLLTMIGRSPTNGNAIVQLRGAGSIGILNLDSLKKNVVTVEVLKTDIVFADINGFDYSKISGNIVIFTNSRLNGGEPGLYIGNLNNKLTLKNISPSIYKDE